MPRLAALTLALVLAAGPAAACLVCIALPERTIADRLVEADTVLLARQDAARPFAFAAVAALKGAAEDPPAAFLVDAATRRRLAADPGAAVLFVRDAEGWSRLGDAGGPARATLEAILAAAPDWERDADGDSRFAFFADRHDHPDAMVRDLALAEISRSPYAQIRTMSPRTPRSETVRVLRDPRLARWAPIHILFLGLSDDPDDHAFVRRAFGTVEAHGGTHLAAWATALAEIDGPPAIERLRARYLDTPGTDAADLQAVVAAFTTLASGGDPALRPGIDEAFRGLAAGPPAAAAAAAIQLARAQDWSQADTFARLLASGAVADPAAKYAIALYLEAAQEAAPLPDPPRDWRLE